MAEVDEFRVSFTLTGSKALEQLLKALPPVAAGRAGEAAVRAGAKVFADNMRRNIVSRGLVLSGRMLGSIKVQTGDKEAGVRTAYAGTTVWYAKFSEFGTAHQPATPWARPAVDESASDALTAMGTTLGAAIAREAGRLAQRTTRRA